MRSHPCCTRSVRCANRLILARMSSADFVQMNGRPSALWASMNSQMAAVRARTLRCTPRRSCAVSSAANQRSMRFSHDAYVGVKWTWKRGRLANHRRMSADVWVP